MLTASTYDDTIRGYTQMACDGREEEPAPLPLVNGSVESASRVESPSSMTTPLATLESYNLEAAERQLCTMALDRAGNIVETAKLLGVTRHALKRRIVKYKLTWPRPGS